MDKFIIVFDDYGKMKCFSDDEQLVDLYLKQRYLNSDTTIKTIKEEHVINYINLFYDHLELSKVGKFSMTTEEERYINKFIRNEYIETKMLEYKISNFKVYNRKKIDNINKQLEKISEYEKLKYEKEVNSFISSYIKSGTLEFKINDLIK